MNPIGVVLGLCWGYLGIMQNNMEATILGVGFRQIVANKNNNKQQVSTCGELEKGPTEDPSPESEKP